MTRSDLLRNALNVIANSDAFWAYAIDWLNDGLREIESYGEWGFLRKVTTYVQENGVDEVAFSASKFPAAAITNYSKNMVIYRPTFGALREFPTIKSFYDARGTGATGAATHFKIDYGSGGQSLFLYPKWVTGDPATTLTLNYTGKITVPTADTSDLETICGLKPKLQVPLINYIRHRLYIQTDDNRQQIERAAWDEALRKLFAEEQTGVGAFGVQSQTPVAGV